MLCREGKSRHHERGERGKGGDVPQDLERDGMRLLQRVDRGIALVAHRGEEVHIGLLVCDPT